MIELYTERLPGGWIVSSIIGGYRVKDRYYGYTKREAIKQFKADYGNVTDYWEM